MTIKFDPENFHIDLEKYDHGSSKIKRIEIEMTEDGQLENVRVERYLAPQKKQKLFME
ncbi:hypothetical protein [Halobacillus sp. H74]|uniref:hypothetical protein n=1 Tax=Halobacillus sp. H74 TaxID=3457436 RepID=UPI003FCD577F